MTERTAGGVHIGEPLPGGLSAVGGVRGGHHTGQATGVTVVLAPDGTTGAGEIRGGAPASRETALLEPGRTVTRVDAVTLTGGSAFGLATADGVMRYLADRSLGQPPPAGPVPIVPTLAIFDLVASGDVSPTVAALVVVNTFGDVIDTDGSVLAGSTAPAETAVRSAVVEETSGA